MEKKREREKKKKTIESLVRWVTFYFFQNLIFWRQMTFWKSSVTVSNLP
jgi:hypothetical protein